MLKKLLFLATALCLSMPVKAQVAFDTLESYSVSPGVYYKKLSESTKPWKINILEINLREQSLKIETAKAFDQLKMFKNNVTLVGPMPTELTSIMSAVRSTNDQVVRAAVNGDFFTEEEGRPYNTQIRNHQILQKPSKAPVIGFDANNNAYLGNVTFEGKVFIHNPAVQSYDSTVEINGINNWRNLNEMWLFNDFIGAEQPGLQSWSGQNQWGTEMLIEPLAPLNVNDTVKCIVRGIRGCCIDTAYRFPKGWVVLSQHRNLDDWLSNIMHMGDTLEIALNIVSGLKHPKEMLGGSPQIVKEGVQYVDQGYIDEGTTIDPTKPHHSKELHARTAAGLSQDGKYLYLVTVDGGDQSNSIGMTLYQFGDFLASYGIYNAVNLNGGQSTTMVINDAVVNQPSLGAEVPVSNALFIIEDNTVDVKKEVYESKEFKLYQNYPNPFNPATKIAFSLKSQADVTLKVFNLLGQEITTLAKGKYDADVHTVEFNAGTLASGIYIYQLNVRSAEGTFSSAAGKMFLIK